MLYSHARQIDYIDPCNVQNGKDRSNLQRNTPYNMTTQKVPQNLLRSKKDHQKVKPLICSLTCIVAIGSGISANAGSITGTGFDRSATIENLKKDVPQSARSIDTKCTIIGVPSGGDNKYRCTVTWE